MRYLLAVAVLAAGCGSPTGPGSLVVSTERVSCCASLATIVLCLQPLGLGAQDAPAPWVNSIGAPQHVAVLVSDIDRSAEWYRTAFGLADAGGSQAALPVTEAQKRLVARLSGWSESEGQAAPFSRSTPEERAVAVDYLLDALAEIGLAGQVHRYRHPNVNGLVDLLLPPFRGANVYVEVPATVATDEVVVLGAHYDSEFRSPGAIDNATGVALVWAVADHVARLPTRSRNFVFVFFDQEEDDEVGSRAFARFLLRGGSPVHSVHIADLAGWDEGGNGLVQIQSPGPELERLYHERAMRLGIPLEVVGGASSDNKSFLAAGMQTVGVFQAEIHPELHTPADTYPLVDFGYLAAMTRLVTAAMDELARP